VAGGCSAAGVVCGNSVEVGDTSPEDVAATSAVASTRAVVAGVAERTGAVVVGAGV